MNHLSLQTRRAFCLQACQTAALAVFGGALSSLVEGGGVTKGPASTSLRSYAMQFVNDQLLITVS
ncbi:hypothetical protein HUU05_06240 [candidate division KSB1 bacterium]|nr:hypothetical protein [candidate division KSB1 bacterium]